MTGSVDDLILRHFGLRENPFGVTPDPRFLFLSHTHREALASLINGIECGFGFQVLVAQPGMGKTTLLFDLLERFSRSRTAFLFQQQHDSREFLQSLLIELQSDTEETSHAKLYGQLNHILSNAALTRERVIVVVDEAQNLGDSLLETIRQLSNFETSRSKLLQIILAGQPQLARKLAHPEQEQLRQRISTIARLSPFGLDETRTYLGHRLNVAGYRGPELFTIAAFRTICSLSRGIPRNVNTLCFNAMLLAFAQGVKQVDEREIEEAAQDLDLDYVLADVAASHEPAVGVGDRDLPSRIVLDGQKLPRNQQPAGAQLPSRNDPQPTIAEPGDRSALVGGEPSRASGISLDAHRPRGNQQPSGVQLSSTNDPRRSIAEPGLNSAPVGGGERSLTSGIVQGGHKPPGNQPSSGAQLSSINEPRPSAAQPGLSSGTRSRQKVFWALLIAAAVGAGVLFGQGLGTRRGRQREERSESFSGLPRAEDPQPVLERPLSQSRNKKEPSSRTDDSPEVVVRTFPRNADDSAEVVSRTFQQTAPTTPDGAVMQKMEPILFEIDSTVVSSRYDAVLLRIAEILIASPQSKAIIEGHTDDSGEESYNSELSNRRALAVKDLLVNEYHIPATRLSTIGAGSSAPIESNLTGRGRAYNRRVEVHTAQPGG
jgi:type II secretory pathway predicted ATPase ExeA/outer membrane protein OmpA-like peptidoglycan-associated protein